MIIYTIKKVQKMSEISTVLNCQGILQILYTSILVLLKIINKHYKEQIYLKQNNKNFWIFSISVGLIMA